MREALTDAAKSLADRPHAAADAQRLKQVLKLDPVKL